METGKSLNKKVIIIIIAALAAAVLGVACAVLLLKGVQRGIPVGTSSAMVSDSVYSELSAVSDIPPTVSEPEKQEQMLRITSPSSLNSTTTSSVAVIRGTSDPLSPVLLNGKELSRNADGSFAYEAQLAVGKNTFTFEHKGLKTVCNITYRYVVINGYSPSKAEKYASGSTFGVVVLARPGSSVTASFNGKTVILTQSQAAAEGVEFVEFTGSFTLPDDNVDDLSLGKIKFTGSFNGVTESFTSGKITCLKNEAVANIPYIAEVVAYTAETFNGNNADDYSRPTNNYLPKGTVDYCDRALVYNDEYSYVKLRCGRRVYTEKENKPGSGGVKEAVVRRYQGTLPDHNEIAFTSFSQNGRHTVLTVDTMWKAPFLLDILPQRYADTVKRDYTVTDTTYEYIDITFCYATVYRGSVNIPSNNPVFSRAEIRKSGNNTVLRLYLKTKGAFYGWDCSYNENGQLVFTFLNPANTVSVSNKYGIDLTGTVILVDAGHGGIDPGAIGIDGSYESNRNLALANKVKAELESLGASVVMTRSGNTNVKYDERCQILKNTKPDYCISIHHDSASAPSASGFSVYYHHAFSFKAARAVSDRTSQAGIYSKQRAFGWHVFYLARMTACPVVLIENGFISSNTDISGIASDAVNQKKAEAIVKGVADYFESIRYEVPEPEIPAEPEPEEPVKPVDPSEPEIPSVPEDTTEESLDETLN